MVATAGSARAAFNPLSVVVEAEAESETVAVPIEAAMFWVGDVILNALRGQDEDDRPLVATDSPLHTSNFSCSGSPCLRFKVLVCAILSAGEAMFGREALGAIGKLRARVDEEGIVASRGNKAPEVVSVLALLARPEVASASI